MYNILILCNICKIIIANGSGWTKSRVAMIQKILYYTVIIKYTYHKKKSYNNGFEMTTKLYDNPIEMIKLTVTFNWSLSYGIYIFCRYSMITIHCWLFKPDERLAFGSSFHFIFKFIIKHSSCKVFVINYIFKYFNRF